MRVSRWSSEQIVNVPRSELPQGIFHATSAAMLRRTLALALSTVLLGSAVKADVLYNDKSITVTGTYTQFVDENSPAKTKPLKMADLLALLGGTAVDPKSVKFYWNDTASSYVIAPKGIADGSDVEPTATFVAFTDDYVTLAKNRTQSVSAGSVVLLNGTINGSYNAVYKYPTKIETDTNTILAYGTINGKATIIRAVLKDTYVYQAE
jgi:hypothetical protein